MSNLLKVNLFFMHHWGGYLNFSFAPDTHPYKQKQLLAGSCIWLLLYGWMPCNVDQTQNWSELDSSLSDMQYLLLKYGYSFILFQVAISINFPVRLCNREVWAMNCLFPAKGMFTNEGTYSSFGLNYIDASEKSYSPVFLIQSKNHATKWQPLDENRVMV